MFWLGFLDSRVPAGVRGLSSNATLSGNFYGTCFVRCEISSCMLSRWGSRGEGC